MDIIDFWVCMHCNDDLHFLGKVTRNSKKRCRQGKAYWNIVRNSTCSIFLGGAILKIPMKWMDK